MDHLTVTLTKDEVVAIAQAVNFRLAYLVRQPRSAERTAEVMSLRSYLKKTLPAVQLGALIERQEQKNSQN